MSRNQNLNIKKWHTDGGGDGDTEDTTPEDIIVLLMLICLR